MSASSYIPLTSHVLAVNDGTIICPHNDSTWDLMGRRIICGMIIAGACVWYTYQVKSSSKSFTNKDVKFRVIDLHKNEHAIRETKNSAVEENSDTTLRSVESLTTISCQSSDVSTQQPDEEPQPFSPFPDGPIGSVSEEEPPKDGKVTKSIQCAGNCTL